jgi:hypothetical protein
MGLNPYTLLPETAEEERERQRVTGQIGNGVTVKCYPTGDPDVTQIQHRAACLIKPYEVCYYCPHSSFTMVFRFRPREEAEAEDGLLVACPRWNSIVSRLNEKAPDAYVSVETGTCKLQPFDACRECPTDLVKLESMGIDKTKEGWYSRWVRFNKDDDDE